MEWVVVVAPTWANMVSRTVSDRRVIPVVACLPHPPPPQQPEHRLVLARPMAGEDAAAHFTPRPVRKFVRVLPMPPAFL